MRICSICAITEDESYIYTTRCKFKKELCTYHYDRFRFSNGNYVRNLQDKNEIIIHTDYCEMYLYNRKGNKVASTLFNIAFLTEVKKYKWSLSKEGKDGNTRLFYAKTALDKNKHNKTVLKLHQLILPCKQPYEVDHKNTDGLDNRLENLRIVTRLGNSENQRSNTSGYPGVEFHKSTGKWQSRITVNKKRVYLGIFDSKEEAAKVREEYKFNNKVK